MSLHTVVTPEIQAKIKAQKRTSTISSIIIAVLISSLLAVTLFYVAPSPLFKNKETVEVLCLPKEPKVKPVNPYFNSKIKKLPASATSSNAYLISAMVPDLAPITLTQINVPFLDHEDPSDFIHCIGNDRHTGSNGVMLPASSRKRCTYKERLERLEEEGGKKEYEAQVVNALKWLQKNQDKDGSWKAQGKPVAMTGLALLAYLGHCETPFSVEFGETVQNAILYLRQIAKKNNGVLTTNPDTNQMCYEHAIATYALAEAYMFCTEFNIVFPGLEEIVLTAGNFIINNQNKDGGWAYKYVTTGGHTDSSIVCWQLQALKACKLTRLDFEGLQKSTTAGLRYLENCKNGKNTIGYQPGSKTTTMTPGAALCFQQWNKGEHPLAQNAIKWISKTNDFEYKVNGNLYMHFYSSQVMLNARGKAWADYHKKTMISLAENQNADGSWSPPADAGHGMTSKHYATCLCTLMMEVYYRYLPSAK